MKYYGKIHKPGFIFAFLLVLSLWSFVLNFRMAPPCLAGGEDDTLPERAGIVGEKKDPPFSRTRDPNHIFYKAGTHYEEGRYDEAIAEYTKLLEQGLESGNLYYNLGNAYFKEGEPGKAILNYERARKFIPRDGDLRSNYEYAASKLENADMNEAGSWRAGIAETLRVFTLDELTIALSVAFVLGVLAYIAAVFNLLPRKSAIAVISTLTILFISLSYSIYGRVSVIGKEAVVISERAEATFEPLENATVHFTLYEGMKVCVLQTRDGWSKVRRTDGKIGWIRENTSEKI